MKSVFGPLCLGMHEGELHYGEHELLCKFPFVIYEMPLLSIMHPVYFRVHYIFGQDITLLNPIRANEIRPWAFVFGNT